MTSSVDEKKIILVIGGTGAQGLAVIKSLLEPCADGSPSPYAIRVLTRDPASRRAQELSSRGVECVKGNTLVHITSRMAHPQGDTQRLIPRFLRRSADRGRCARRRVRCMGEHRRLHGRRAEGGMGRAQDLRAREAGWCCQTLCLEQPGLFAQGQPSRLIGVTHESVTVCLFRPVLSTDASTTMARRGSRTGCARSRPMSAWTGWLGPL